MSTLFFKNSKNFLNCLNALISLGFLAVPAVYLLFVRRAGGKNPAKFREEKDARGADVLC
jgi:hypothetical protein